jgi:hypothetical protein
MRWLPSFTGVLLVTTTIVKTSWLWKGRASNAGASNSAAPVAYPRGDDHLLLGLLRRAYCTVSETGGAVRCIPLALPVTVTV